MMHRALPLVAALALSSGCAQSDGPEPRTQAEITASQLANELPTGASQLCPFVTRYQADPTAAELATLASRDRATGRTLVDVALGPPPDSLGLAQPRSSALFSVDAGGQVRLLPRIAEGVVPDAVVMRRPVPGLGAIVSCTATDANGVRLEGDSVVPFDDAPGACLSADVAGESLRAGRWVFLERTSTALVAMSRSVHGEPPSTRSLPKVDDSAVIVWAREAADESIAIVTRTATGFEWRNESAAPVALAVTAPVEHRIVFDDALDSFVLRGPDGAAIVWSPQRGTEQRLPAPAAPAGATGWTYSGAPTLPFAEVASPNPSYTPNRIPSQYVVSLLSNGGLQNTDARLTPCVDSTRCRALGESYLLGTIEGPTPFGIYAFWSWESLATLVAAPLFPGSAQ